MKFSESWLRTFVNPSLSSDELCHMLTMAGLEVEEAEPAAPAFSQVVVGEIKQIAKHPNADRLNVCQVDVGQASLLKIVCGAPNVAVGMKVPCALIGARLPADSTGQQFEIKRAKMRGVESEGMLCSAKELGMSEDHAGLLPLPSSAVVGADVRRALDLDDRLITIKLTPNRADALSLLGVAREVSALTGSPLTLPVFDAVKSTLTDQLKVVVHNEDLCGRFSGRLVRGVNAKAPTPDWMKTRLERSGQRPISALVDISNYVMLELGRPTHIFDASKIQGQELHVRWGRANEQVALLNGKTVGVDETVGVIADAAGPEALAGIMGGEATSVTLDTTDIFIEAAFWWPQAIQGRARRFNFTTEAGHRFERGVDFSTTVEHIDRITALVLEICGGNAGPVIDDVQALPERKPIRLRIDRCRKVIGVALDKAVIVQAFDSLGLPTRDLGDAIEVTPPAYRFDLNLEEDLIEEVARLHGFDNLPALPPVSRASMQVQLESTRPLLTIKKLMAGRDYSEVINYSFVDEAWERDLCNNDTPIRVLNPIASQLGVMRSSLFGGLIANVAYNVNRKQTRVRAFEVGSIFGHDNRVIDGPLAVAGVAQRQVLGAIAFGTAADDQWGVKSRAVDFFDIKGDLESLVGAYAVHFQTIKHPALHPGRSAAIMLDRKEVGIIGELHPRWVQVFGLPGAPVMFEIDLASITKAPVVVHQDVSKFPSLSRDIALALPAVVQAGDVLDTLKEAAGHNVLRLDLFDEYRPQKGQPGLSESEKSLAFRVVMQDTQKTLTDAEADETIEKMVNAAQKKHQARLRA